MATYMFIKIEHKNVTLFKIFHVNLIVFFYIENIFQKNMNIITY